MIIPSLAAGSQRAREVTVRAMGKVLAMHTGEKKIVLGELGPDYVWRHHQGEI